MPVDTKVLYAYYVTDIPASNQLGQSEKLCPKYNKLEGRIVHSFKGYSQLDGESCTFFSISLHGGRIPLTSLYPLIGQIGFKYHRILIPLNRFQDYNLWLCSGGFIKNLLLTKGDIEAEKASKLTLKKLNREANPYLRYDLKEDTWYSNDFYKDGTIINLAILHNIELDEECIWDSVMKIDSKLADYNVCYAYHVTNIPTTQDCPKYEELQLEKAELPELCTQLEEDICILFSTSMAARDLPSTSNSVTTSTDEVKYHRVLVPLHRFKDYDFWLLSTYDDRITLLLTKGEVEFEKASKLDVIQPLNRIINPYLRYNPNEDTWYSNDSSTNGIHVNFFVFHNVKLDDDCLWDSVVKQCEETS